MEESFRYVQAFEKMMRQVHMAQELEEQWRTRELLNSRMLQWEATSERIRQETERLLASQRHVAEVLERQRIAEQAVHRHLEMGEAATAWLEQAAQLPRWQRELDAHLQSQRTIQQALSLASSPLNELLRVHERNDTYWRKIAETSLTYVAQYQRLFERDQQSALQDAIAEELAQAEDQTLLEVITRAVLRVLGDAVKGSDSRFILGLIFAIVVPILQQYAADADQAAMMTEIQEQLAANQSALIRAVMTKTVRRTTKVWARPTSHSRRLGLAEEGESVIVKARRSKWALVVVLNRANGSVLQGWMLNKHLE